VAITDHDCDAHGELHDGLDPGQRGPGRGGDQVARRAGRRGSHPDRAVSGPPPGAASTLPTRSAPGATPWTRAPSRTQPSPIAVALAGSASSASKRRTLPWSGTATASWRAADRTTTGSSAATEVEVRVPVASEHGSTTRPGWRRSGAQILKPRPSSSCTGSGSIWTARHHRRSLGPAGRRGCPQAARPLVSTGDVDVCWRFHLAQEHRRVHQARYQAPLVLAA
jgi:hypothetical protein